MLSFMSVFVIGSGSRSTPLVLTSKNSAWLKSAVCTWLWVSVEPVHPVPRALTSLACSKVHAEELQALLKLYEKNGYFDEVISLLESGLGKPKRVGRPE